MLVRIFALLALLLTVAAATVGADIATSAAPAVHAFVDHVAHAFVGGGAFMAVMAAPLPPTVPFAVSIAEAGRLMGVSRALIYQLINAGELSVVKIGTRTVIRTDVIQRFLAANAGVPDPNLSPLKRAERKAAEGSRGRPRTKPAAPIAASPPEHTVNNESAAAT
jgi:excisionase family DNA binding protein